MNEIKYVAVHCHNLAKQNNSFFNYVVFVIVAGQNRNCVKYD